MASSYDLKQKEIVMTDKSKFELDLEKAKKAKERAERRIANLKKKQEEIEINNRLTLLSEILKDPSIVDFLRNRSINQDLLNEALEKENND